MSLHGIIIVIYFHSTDVFVSRAKLKPQKTSTSIDEGMDVNAVFSTSFNRSLPLQIGGEMNDDTDLEWNECIDTINNPNIITLRRI